MSSNTLLNLFLKLIYFCIYLCQFFRRLSLGHVEPVDDFLLRFLLDFVACLLNLLEFTTEAAKPKAKSTAVTGWLNIFFIFFNGMLANSRQKRHIFGIFLTELGLFDWGQIRKLFSDLSHG